MTINIFQFSKFSKNLGIRSEPSQWDPKWVKIEKMAPRGAREVNSQKGQHSALSNLIGFIDHQRVWKSVVSEIQKTIFKKVPLKKKVT